MAGIQFEIAHAVWEDDRYYFDTEDGRMGNVFARMKCNYLLTGHSRKQYLRSAVTCTLRQVPYDLGKVIHSQFASGIMDYAKFWALGILYDIITGEEWVLALLRREQAAEMGMKFTEQEILELLCV